MNPRSSGEGFAPPSGGMEGLRAVSIPASDTLMAGASAVDAAAKKSDWRDRLPILRSGKITLRELQSSDAQALWAFINSTEVTKFLSTPPTTVDAFERFITWTQQQRAAGTQAAFAVVVEGFDTPVGLFQLRQLEPGFGTAEWGFAIGSAFWGTGVFQASAELMLEFIFDTLGTHRLEARAAVKNGRGTGALRKMGAVQEGILRKSFLRDGRYLDQALYAILEDDWRASRETKTTSVYAPHIH